MAVSAITAVPAHPKVHTLAELKRGHLSPADQTAAVASQFEAILMRQFLQDSIGSMMGGSDKGAGAGGGGNVYSYMLTDTLADKLSQGGGMGLASVIARQLTPRGASGGTPAASAKQP